MEFIDLTPTYDKILNLWTIGDKYISNESLEDFEEGPEELVEVLTMQDWDQYEISSAVILLSEVRSKMMANKLIEEIMKNT